MVKIIPLLLILIAQVIAEPYPIQFSIPESKIVDKIPEKDRDFAYIIPGKLDTYIYNEESDYYKDYQRSYFAVTCKKAGWDCMRHYEILANGCIPYFLDLDDCHPQTMPFLPKDLIKEAMNLNGVSFPHIDHNLFDKEKYSQILNKLLDHTRNYLTTKSIANYLLQTIKYNGGGTLLFLSGHLAPDYMRCLTLAGLKEILGTRVIDYPKISHIYKSYPDNVKHLYGKGFSYTKIIDDLPVNREDIPQRIKNREFDIIIYGSIHRGLPFYDLVMQNYPPEKIAYICGEDAHICQGVNLANFFLREFDSIP